MNNQSKVSRYKVSKRIIESLLFGKLKTYTRVYLIKDLFKTIFTGRKIIDDFDWDLYTQHYRGELVEVADHNSTILESGQYIFNDGILQKKQDILDLHPNHFLLYETVLQLKPRSVLEIGCGGGDHLHNLKVLRPSLELYGEDRSRNQLTLLHERHPQLDAQVVEHNITSETLIQRPAIDLVYSQAVIMHIKDNHLKGLANMFTMAKQYVVLMENWHSHDFVADLLKLQFSGLLGWKSLYLSARPVAGTTQPYILIASREAMPQYIPINNDDQLREQLGHS